MRAVTSTLNVSQLTLCYINVEVISEQWTNSLTVISREFRKMWDEIERSSQNQIYTYMVKMILKSWYIAWEEGQEEGIEKTLEKKTRELVTGKELLTLG